MTFQLHLEDFECPSCKALIIPYATNLPCPKCEYIINEIPEGYAGFLGQCAASIYYNKRRYGMYEAPAWNGNTFNDQVQVVLKRHFGDIVDKNPSELNGFLEEYFREKDYLPYLKKHLADMLIIILKHFNEIPFPVEVQERQISTSSATKRWGDYLKNLLKNVAIITGFPLLLLGVLIEESNLPRPAEATLYVPLFLLLITWWLFLLLLVLFFIGKILNVHTLVVPITYLYEVVKTIHR